MQCPTCEAINPAQARYCMNCGVLLVQGVVCSQCHTLLPPQARYCYHCGAFLAQSLASQAGPAPIRAAPMSMPPQMPATPTTRGAPPAQASGGPASPAFSSPVAPQANESGASVSAATPIEAASLPATAQSLQDRLPSLQRYLTKNLYEPLEGVPLESELLAALDHLSTLTSAIKTYLPWPVVVSPQPAGVPKGGMYRGVFLFGDVSGFTPLSEKLKALKQEGAEIITNLINALFTDLVGVLFDHGGTLLKFGGDALLGLFPAQTDEEMVAAALHAAQAALAMQEVLQKEQFSNIQVLEGKHTLRIKCGISAGPYFAAHIGTPPSNIDANGTMAFVTTGTTVNLAEEAEGHANPEEVAMTDTVKVLLGDRVQTGPASKEPDDHFFRLISAPQLGANAARLEMRELSEGDTISKITYFVERLDRLTPYLSDELVSRIVSAPKIVRIIPENRPVTMMFANYKGISKLIEKMGDSDPDLITRHLNDYFVHMVSIVEKYEGNLARMDQYAVGDRLVIFFGAPRAHEDDAVRAVTTALEMQEAARKNFSALRTATGVYRFEQRVGINTGYLFAGNVGVPNLRQEYTLMGDDINMAARLMSNATWGSIFISKNTKEQVEAFFELENLGEIKVKGKEIRIPTFKILGQRDEIGRTRGFEEGETPLVGRRAQLESLQKSGRDFLNSRRGQIVTIIGNSGLGKSRLLREVRSWLTGQEQARDLLWIEVRAMSFSEQMSYWMASEAIRGLLNLDSKANQDDTLYALSERCEALFGSEAMNSTPYLAHMMGLDLGEEWAWVKKLDPKVRQKQIFRTAANFFATSAKEHPLIIALDDLHWADEASLALFEHLLDATDKAAIMFCLIFRPRRDKGCWKLRDRAEAEYPHRYNEVTLDPLSLELSSQLLSLLSPGAEFNPETRAEILDKAAGNPFYLEEVVRSLRETGAVERDPHNPGQWQATSRISEIKVPSTLQAAIVARIDRLNEDSRMALQAAAVIGREFRFHLFSNLIQAEAEINFWLAQLERGGLVQPAEISEDPLYNFPDALVQEVAYDSLLVQNRRQLHGRVADVVDELLKREAEETQQDIEQLHYKNCELLAYHFKRSDRPEQAIPFLEIAAQKAQNNYANDTAIHYYQQLLEIRQKTGDQAGQARALLSMGKIAYEIGDFERARPWLQQAAALNQQIGDLQNEGWSVMYLGMVDLKQANYAEAATYHSQALDSAHQRGDQFQEGIHLTNLARVNMRLGQYDLALEQFQRSLEMKRQVNDLNGVGFALFYRGLIHIYQEQFEQAKADLQGAIEAWQQLTQNERVISYYHYGIGLLALALGQFGKAQESLQKAFDLSTKLELRAEIIENLSALSQARLGLGEPHTAIELSSTAIKLLSRQKDVEEIQQIYFNHYLVLLACDAPDAIEYLQQAQSVVLERADRISDAEKRQIYLQKVKVNLLIATALADLPPAN